MTDPELTQEWLRGEINGARTIVRRLREMAGEAFADGDDRTANALRRVAEQITVETVADMVRKSHAYALKYGHDVKPIDIVVETRT